MSKTVVGLFPSTVVAEDVRQQIINSGFAESAVRIVARDHEAHHGAGEKAGIGDKISHFFKSLTGGDDTAHEHYAGGLNRGGALLAITTEDADVEGAADVLLRHGATEIEGDVNDDDAMNTGETSGALIGERTAAFGSNVLGRGRAVADESIPVVEEDLVVGKRQVDRGGVRVYSHIVETPVATDVTLRDENVIVERRSVDRPATAADFTPGDRSYELRASGEEAVIGKTARIVEEVRVGKDTTDRTEAIRDTVRHTEVEVEEIPVAAGSGIQSDRNRL